MSHISQIQREELFDIEVLKKVVLVEGKITVKLLHNQKEFEHWPGMSQACDHALSISFTNDYGNATKRELGLRKDPVKNGYHLLWDELALKKVIGEQAGLLTREYDIQKTLHVANYNNKEVNQLMPYEVNELGISSKDGWKYLRIEV